MKHIYNPITVMALLLSLGVCLTGCASSNEYIHEEPAVPMQMVHEDLSNLYHRIDGITEALDRLTNSEYEDNASAYDAYINQLFELEYYANRVSAHFLEMNIRGEDYFYEWQKKDGRYINPIIQNLNGNADEAGSCKIYHQVKRAKIGFAGSLLAYLTDLRDIKNYLEGSPSSNRVEEIFTPITLVITDGEILKDATSEVQFAISGAMQEVAFQEREDLQRGITENH